jgi:RNA polymerase sigma-70 factor (family 1)
MSKYLGFTDRELIESIREGDQGAYTEIFSRYNKLLYSHTYNKLRNREEAKDIVQDIFYSLWANRGKSLPDNNLIGYLFMATRYKIADLLSRQQVKDKYIVSLQQYINLAPEYSDHLVRRNQLSDIIEEEISALPPRMQEILRLSRFEHLSHKEIAERLNITEATSKDQVKKALRILRKRLGFHVLLYFFLVSSCYQANKAINLIFFLK